MGGIDMVYYHISYDIIAKNGAERTYRRRFDDNGKAVEFARRKVSEPHVKQVRGFEHDERDGVVRVFKMAL